MNTFTQEKPFAVTMRPLRKRPRLFRRLDRVMRRMLDLSVSLAGLFFLSPFFVFIALLIKKDSPGPAFYRGRRVGRRGKEFDILKFRTMYETPESHDGPKVTAKGDERITPVGNWLRRTKLNELPQLWNVLIGEMSLVGPRPEDPEIVKTWPEDARKELLSVRPGITSPASVLYRDEESLLTPGNVMDDYLRTILPTKLRLDQLYVRNRSLFSDLDMIFWTLIILIPQARREKIPEAQLYWGPLSVFMAHDFRWFIIDFLVAMGSVTTVGVIWRSITPLHIGWQYAPLIALAMALATSLANAVRGLNRVYWAKASPAEALDILFSTVMATTLVWLTDLFLLTGIHVPVGLFIFGGMVAYLGFVAVRYRERILTGLATRWLSMRQGGSVIGERLLIVGAGELGQFATWLVRKGNLAQAFTLVGMVDDDPRKQGMRIDGVNVLGSTEDLKNLVDHHDIGILLFAIANIEPEEKKRILSLCQSLPVRTVMIPNVVAMMRDEFRGSKPDGQGDDAIPGVFSAARMSIWLHELENLMQVGDYAAVQKQIEHLRGEMPVEPLQ